MTKDSDLAKKDNEPGNRQPSDFGVEDSYLDRELGIRRDDEGLHNAKMKRRAVDENGKPIDENGKPIGRPSNNPLLDSRKYEAEYADGNTEVLAANK